MHELEINLENRHQIYKILASLYQAEITAETLGDFKQIRFPVDSENEQLSENAQKLNAFIAELREENLDDLAADYARTFLSAGVADEPAAFPIESVYTSREKLIMQDAYEAVGKILHQHGIAPAHKDLYPDHLGIELEFMSFLCTRAKELLRENQLEKLQANLEEQKRFLQEHLCNWTDRFFDDQLSVARTDFYRALAGFSRAFLRADHQWLSA